MSIAVRYYSKSGHTELIARKIAEAVGVEAQPIDVPLEQNVDLLFLCGAPYAFHLAQPLRQFIEHLQPSQVKAVAAFSTSGSPLGASGLIHKECEKAGLTVLPEEFHCTGASASSPKQMDAAMQFARQVATAAAEPDA